MSASQGDSGRPKRFGLSSPGRQLAKEPRIPRIIINAGGGESGDIACKRSNIEAERLSFCLMSHIKARRNTHHFCKLTQLIKTCQVETPGFLCD